MSLWLQTGSKLTRHKKTPNQEMPDPNDSQVRQIMISFDLLTAIFLTMNLFYSITLLLIMSEKVHFTFRWRSIKFAAAKFWIFIESCLRRT